MRSGPLVCATSFALLLAAACGGKAAELPGGGGDEGGGGGGGDAAADASRSDDGRGAMCVDVDLGSYDQSCASDSDCTFIRAGQVCSGQCDCGSSLINVAGEARYEGAIAGLSLQACPCDEPGIKRCLGGRCTLCDFGPNAPAACIDDGGPAQDTGVTVDTGVEIDAGPICVFIDPSTYDRSCVEDIDCIGITAGKICTGGCQCGGAAINASEQARYNAAIAPVGMGGICPCPAFGPIRCAMGQCTVCSFGLNPPPPPGCGDGG
jgi:hypothetical protein